MNLNNQILLTSINLIQITSPILSDSLHPMYGVSSEAQYISNKYNIQIDTLYFEWNKFITILHRHFSDILNEMLNHHCQWHPSDQHESRSIT